MPLVTVDATILQAFPYSETSKILRLLTRTHGVQSVIARGARRPKSRYGGVLEPFTDGIASFSLRPNRDLQTLTEFELQRPRQRLGQDLVRFGGASLVAEIVLRTGSEQPAPEVFARVRLGLDSLQSSPSDRVEAEALAQAWALISTMGFAPFLDQCVVCGAPLPPGDLFLDYGAGGMFCGACGGGGGGGRVLPERARRDLKQLCEGNAVPLDHAAAHWQLLSRFLSYHLVEPGSLRSLDFLAAALEVS